MIVTAPYGGPDTDQRQRVGVAICGRVMTPNSSGCRFHIAPQYVLALWLQAAGLFAVTCTGSCDVGSIPAAGVGCIASQPAAETDQYD